MGRYCTVLTGSEAPSTPYLSPQHQPLDPTTVLDHLCHSASWSWAANSPSRPADRVPGNQYQNIFPLTALGQDFVLWLHSLSLSLFTLTHCLSLSLSCLFYREASKLSSWPPWKTASRFLQPEATARHPRLPILAVSLSAHFGPQY